MRKIVYVVTSTLALIALSSAPAYCQSILETPDGHQIIGPAQMGQQPSVAEEFSTKATGRTYPPPVGVDLGGVPGFQTTTAGSPPANTGVVPNAPTNAVGAPAKAPKLPPAQAPITAPGATAQPGALVLPQGEASTVRVGPVFRTPDWVRGVLAAWLLLQFVAIILVAIALTRRENTAIDEQHGHLIRPDFREPADVMARRGGY